MYNTWKNIKKSYKNNKFKISAPTWNEEFEIPDGSYSISDIQDYFEYILKKREEKTIDHSIRIYTNRIELTYFLEPLTPETMKLLGSTKSKITKDENRKNVPYLQITEVALMHCNVVNNGYQQSSRVLYIFVTNKSFGQLLDISPENFIF